MKTREVKIGDAVILGGGGHIVVQTMCNTHTNDETATLDQCIRLAEAGAEMIRLTVPGPDDVSHIRRIREELRSRGILTPIIADIHFSSATAIAVAPFVDKVRINPGNFHPDHGLAKERFSELIDICRTHGTAIRIGLNHGSLGKYITDLYGNSPLAMAKAAMEWISICREKEFDKVVVSLKSSNTVSMVQAYRLLASMMEESGCAFPLHVGVTEAGNGDSGRMKSCVGISTLLSEGIGDTVRVSLTEDPVNEIPVAAFLSKRYSGAGASSMVSCTMNGRTAVATYNSPSREALILDLSCDFGGKLLDREIDDISFGGTYLDETSGKETEITEEFAQYLRDELLQASRRRFYKPEYIACPGCGRTMYDLQAAFETVKKKTSHLKGTVIAVMGCIVNGPGEMADADWGYVGEGNGLVSIYRRSEPVLRHVPQNEAADKLAELIEDGQ